MPVRSVWPVFTGKAAKKRTSVPYQPEVRRQGGLSDELRPDVECVQKRADEIEDEDAADGSSLSANQTQLIKLLLLNLTIGQVDNKAVGKLRHGLNVFRPRARAVVL
jgi:hypothetical protein